jgi:SAM-dependent methyltransferase
VTAVASEILGDLEGAGIEIGAFHSPLAVGPKARVTYVDVYAPEVARRYYPEVLDAAPVVNPDVLAPADRLPMPDSSLDFVLSSHLIEHVADPIGALVEWHRVLRNGGLLFLRAPDQRGTFDRHRQRTTLEHLVADHRDAPDSAERKNRDLDHYREWARCVNEITDAAQADFWAKLLMRVAYPIHFHCWIPEDMDGVFEHVAALGASFSVFARDSRVDLFEFTIAARAVK